MFICFNGKVIKELPEEIQVSPFLDVTVFGLSVFETLRTYKQKVFELELHLDRLFNSLKTLEIDLLFIEEKRLRIEIIANISELLVKNKSEYSDSDFRIKIFLCSNFYWIQFTKLVLPNHEIYKIGVVVKDVIHERIFPTAKYPNPAYPVFMKKVQKLKIFEMLFFDKNDFVREGNISNIFMVKGGKVYTPRKNILEGVTRLRVIQSAKLLGLSVLEQEISRDFLKKADEIFITNTTKELVPVREWGEWINKDFKITKKIHKVFKEVTN